MNPENASNASVKIAAQTTDRAVSSKQPSNPNAQNSQQAAINRNQNVATSISNPTTTATPVQRPNQVAQQTPNLNAAQGNVARTNTNQASNQIQKLTAVNNNPAETTSGSNLTQRRESQQTSQSESANQNNSPQRASQVAANLASPTNADTPANATAVAVNNTPSLEQSQRATSKAESGQSGAAAGENLAQLSSAADSQAQVSD